MTSQRPLAGALDKVFPHLLILLYGLGAAVIYDHHWPFRGHGDSPILDLVEHHYPTFYKALTLWHYLPPVVVTYLAALLLPRALTLIRSWCPPWKTFSRLLASARDRVFPHLPLFLCSLAAAVIYDHHWPYRGHGDSPILDLVDFHHPAFYKALEVWHYLAPVVAAYLAALALPRALTLIRSWRSPWKTFLRLPWNIFLRLLNLIQISTQHTALLLFAFTVAWIHYYYRPFTQHSEDPLLVLIAVHDPGFYTAITVWYYLAPGVAVLLAGLLLLSVYRVWIAKDGPQAARGALPSWPLSPDDDTLRVVIGETHHPVQAKESNRPGWLTIPEKGLFTGLAIFGAVGSGKTSACMYPFAQQILSWQAKNSQRRAAGLVLEVKGDFCHSIRKMLAEVGREDDYIEIGLRGRWQWNPLASSWLDSYSLAYTISSLLNQLFGKGKEPFWQQAYTNLIRWILELHRLLPDGSDGWVTMQDVYRCTIDAAHLESKLREAELMVAERCGGELRIAIEDHAKHLTKIKHWGWTLHYDTNHASTPFRSKLQKELHDLDIKANLSADYSNTVSRLPLTVEAIRRWHDNDWKKLDTKVRTSIVEGISVFLSMFDLPEIASVFCPPKPETQQPDPNSQPSTHSIAFKHLPPLDTLIEQGKVLCLNMPAGANPALARSIGVMLKNAWLQALLRRPEKMLEEPDKYFRPALFLCDEYQAFATVGEDDPSGDEKSFALTRQCKCIPIVASQSISSLRSALHGGEAWRTLLQTLRTKLFLSLSDDSSSKIASDLCGTVARMKASYSFSENTGRAGVSLLSARPGGSQGTLGSSKSYREQREPVFHPRDFSLLSNCQAVCLPYDGLQSLPPRRVYLKPHYLPSDSSYWEMKRAGKL